MTNKQSIAYIDDEDINLLVFSMLFKNDFKVHTFNSAKEALSFLFENSVDLVLTDQSMPEMLGSQFLEKYSETVPDNRSKTAIVSGFHQNAEISESLEKSFADEFFPKPWEYDTLVIKLKELLGES